MIILKSPPEIEKMKGASKIVAQVLAILEREIKPGVTLLDLNDLAEAEALKRQARPAFKGYGGFPSSLCCSVNEQVIHGIPTQRRLLEGDIVSLDFGVIFDSYYGDAAITVPVGNVSSNALRLIKATRESLGVAIAAAQPGRKLSDISNAVQKYVEQRGFSVVRDFVGHGIGKALHESPQIPNYGLPGKGPILRPGMVLAIEPMINEKDYNVTVLDDGWTTVTRDGGLSAHFEHTVAITESGPVILTEIDNS
jgi:methionyl aminopeptidase